MALLAVKKPLGLLRGIKSKHYSDFYCLNCLHFFRTKNKMELNKKVCKDKDFCNGIMSFAGTGILEFNQYQKSDRAAIILYAYLQCIVEKIDECKNNPEHLYTTKVCKSIPSGLPMSTISLFRSIKYKHGVYRGNNCMKKFCEYLRDHAMKIINFIFLKK